MDLKRITKMILIKSTNVLVSLYEVRIQKLNHCTSIFTNGRPIREIINKINFGDQIKSNQAILKVNEHGFWQVQSKLHDVTDSGRQWVILNTFDVLNTQNTMIKQIEGNTYLKHFSPLGTSGRSQNHMTTLACTSLSKNNLIQWTNFNKRMVKSLLENAFNKPFVLLDNISVTFSIRSSEQLL